MDFFKWKSRDRVYLLISQENLQKMKEKDKSQIE